MKPERTEVLHATFASRMVAMDERRALRKQGKDVELRRLTSGRWGVYIVKQEGHK